MTTTNFLPWRHQQQHACWRFWVWLFAGSGLVSLAVMINLRTGDGLKVRALEAHLAGERVIQQKLHAHRAQWQALQKAHPQTLQAGVQRAKTQAWQSSLISLASAMPEQAWLTQLQYQQPRLMLTGFAATPVALSALAASLRQLPGFTLGPAGEMQQDAEGRWTFSFTLTSQG